MWKRIGKQPGMQQMEVASTPRFVVRIISARRATRDEQDDYNRQNAAGPDAGPKS
jgi:uncharacterized DUF497 family protein